MKKFYICLTFDTDPDPDPDKSHIDSKDKNIIGWRGLRIGNKLIFKSIKKIEKKYQIIFQLLGLLMMIKLNISW